MTRDTHPIHGRAAGRAERPAHPARRGGRRFAGAAASAALLAVVLGACGATSNGPATTPTTIPTTTAPGASTTPTTAPLGGLLPLYPFTSDAQVAAWQASYRSGGHQPWHLQAGATATAFAAWLGFHEIDHVVGTTTDAAGAHVAVGLEPPGGSTPVTAAVVHLVRWGTGSDAPWEVVGTDDTTLTITRPAYGSAVASPAPVGGSITGVDEQIALEVHDAATSATVGTACCLPAGGTGSPWQLTVSFSAPSGAILVIAAHTGGHVAAVERFAVTGVRAS